MRRCLYLVIIFGFLVACDTSLTINQPGKNYFLKYFGGDGNQKAVDLIVNDDGTFFVLGNSRSNDAAVQKIYLAKANALGELVWEKTYGNLETEATDFLLTADKNYLVVVAKRGLDAILIRFTNAGNSNDSTVISNAQANSVTELSDGSFIVEGYQTFGIRKAELHFRWVGNPWGQYGGGAVVWNPNFVADIANSAADFVGVKTIEHSPNVFYTFGYTTAQYGSINNKEKFWAYWLGQSGGSNKNTDLGAFDKQGYSQDKKLTCVVKAFIGGYLVAGISSNLLTDSLKVAITDSQAPDFNFSTSGVFKDVLLQDLGKPANSENSFVTVYSSPYTTTFHNFILANKYNTAPTPTSDILLMKVDNGLKPMWGGGILPNFVLFGGAGDDTAAAVSELPDGHIMVLGTMQLGNPPGQFKIVLMKLNASGGLGD